MLFLCLPHGAAHAWAARGTGGRARSWWTCRPITGYRTLEPIERGMGMDAPTPDVLAQAVYGLTEWRRDRTARKERPWWPIPGCYPDQRAAGGGSPCGHLDGARIIADCKSGTCSGRAQRQRGAGCSPKSTRTSTSYNIGHVPPPRGVRWSRSWGPRSAWSSRRIRQPVTRVHAEHALPGHGTICLSASDDRHAAYRTFKAMPTSRSWWILPGREIRPSRCSTSVHTNRCTISLHRVPRGTVSRTLIVVSVIDNLLKGAARAGGAVHERPLRLPREPRGLAGAPAGRRTARLLSHASHQDWRQRTSTIPSFWGLLAAAIKALPQPPVLVHGGGRD